MAATPPGIHASCSPRPYATTTANVAIGVLAKRATTGNNPASIGNAAWDQANHPNARAVNTMLADSIRLRHARLIGMRQRALCPNGS
jgi:hypothetical protein